MLPVVTRKTNTSPFWSQQSIEKAQETIMFLCQTGYQKPLILLTKVAIFLLFLLLIGKQLSTFRSRPTKTVYERNIVSRFEFQMPALTICMKYFDDEKAIELSGYQPLPFAQKSKVSSQSRWQIDNQHAITHCSFDSIFANTTNKSYSTIQMILLPYTNYSGIFIPAQWTSLRTPHSIAM